MVCLTGLWQFRQLPRVWWAKESPSKVLSVCHQSSCFLQKEAGESFMVFIVCSLHVKWKVVFTMVYGCSQSGVTSLDCLLIQVTLIRISGSSSYSRSACIVHLTFLYRCTNGNSGISISREVSAEHHAVR